MVYNLFLVTILAYYTMLTGRSDTLAYVSLIIMSLSYFIKEQH